MKLFLQFNSSQTVAVIILGIITGAFVFLTCLFGSLAFIEWANTFSKWAMVFTLPLHALGLASVIFIYGLFISLAYYAFRGDSDDE